MVVLTPPIADKGLDLLQQSLIIAVRGGDCKTDPRSALRRGDTTSERGCPWGDPERLTNVFRS